MSSYALNRDIRSFEAAAAVTGYLIVAGHALTGSRVRTAAASTDRLVGIAERVGGKVGDMLDVTIGGVTEVRAGGTFAAFDLLTTDAAGRAIKAEPIGSALVQTIGMALEDGVLGAIIQIDVQRGILTKPAA